MIATLEQTQSQLSHLVKLASEGEEVLITDGGKPVAKLVAIPKSPVRPANNRQWVQELRTLAEKCGTGKVGMTTEQLIDEDRADRF